MTRRIACIAVLSVGVFAGCEPPKPIDVGSLPSAQVDHIDLLLMPTAVDAPETPGPDGLQTRVFFYRNDAAQTVPDDGKLDVLLFNGRVTQRELPWAQPIHRWTYTGAELAPYRNQALGLWNYHLMLLWSPARPQASVVTIVARYTQPDGTIIPSGPVSLTIADR